MREMISFVWLSILITSIEAAAKPLASVTKLPDGGDLVTVLASDKLLGPLLLSNAVTLIVILGKWILSSERRRLEEIQKAVSLIPGLMHKVEVMDEHLKKNVPTHDAVELKIYRAMKDKPL